MAGEFDPYHVWLGINAKDQPPNHYRLLGIELFEANLDVIQSAADRQMALDPGGGQPDSPLTFKLLGDGRVLWQSKPINRRGVAQECSARIRGVRILRLEVFCPGRHDKARAVWVDPRVIGNGSGSAPSPDIIAEDHHHGFSGAKKRDHVYVLRSPRPVNLRNTVVQYHARGSRSSDSNGTILLSMNGRNWVPVAKWTRESCDEARSRGNWHEFVATMSEYFG